MLTIRNMKAGDWEEVSGLDVLAFNSYLQKTGRETRTDQRSQTNLIASLAMHPKGCFVATNDKLVGYIFSRTWGKLGWIGTFGVDPDYHTQGIGTQLIRRAIGSLKEAGCTTIGLETMSDSTYNVGFYTKLGFNPTYPTLNLTKPATSVSAIPSFSLLSEVNQKEALGFITDLSRAASQNVDYMLESQNAKEYGWGDTLLFGWPDPYGFGIIRTISPVQGLSQSICGVICVVLEPKSRNKLGEVLQLLQNFAFEKKASQIMIPVNSIDDESLQELLKSGFQVSGIMLRMIYQGKYKCPEGIDMSRWAM